MTIIIPSQLALAYPIDEEKGIAKYDKCKHVLTVTLPVLPPKTPLSQPLPSNSLPTTEMQETEQDLATTSSNLPCDEEDRKLEEVSSTEASSSQDHILPLPSSQSLDPPATAETVTDGSPDADIAVTSPIVQAGEMENWSSKGHFVCPPFSYRQDNGVVVFCLHTSGVKEQSLVNLFDDHFVSVPTSLTISFMNISVANSL